MLGARSSLFVSGFLAAAWSGQMCAQDQAWMARPEIRQVRAVYQTIETAVAQNRYEQRTREFEYCQPSFTHLTIYLDSAKTVRLYEKRGGSDDSARLIRYYYDPEGHLRFVYTRTGAAGFDGQGTTLEERLYLSAAGDSLYTDRRVVEGGGYFWVSPMRVWDPMADFLAGGPCPEK
jgi:hypothetical protein